MLSTLKKAAGIPSQGQPGNIVGFNCSSTVDSALLVHIIKMVRVIVVPSDRNHSKGFRSGDRNNW